MDHHQLAASLLSRPSFDVIAWIDPVCDHGLPTDSDEALVILCPVLGPSATIVLHRLARYASIRTDHVGAHRVRRHVRAVEECADRTRREGREPDGAVRVRQQSARPHSPCAPTYHRSRSDG